MRRTPRVLGLIGDMPNHGPDGWTAGPRMLEPGVFGYGIRENLALWRKWDSPDMKMARPQFDLMGRLQEWAKEKQMSTNPNTYFYLEYLVDMEGYPLEMKNVELNPAEHTNLRLLSHAEERKFWKAYYYYVQQYEYEDPDATRPYSALRMDNVIYALRQAGIASKPVLEEFKRFGMDDHMLSGLSLESSYSKCKFTDDVLNVLDGNCVTEMLASFANLTPDDSRRFLLHLLTLKILPVQLLDQYGNVVRTQHLTFDQAPTLDSLLAAFDLEGGTTAWYVDVRGFFSTPGRMLFDAYNYEQFLLDWFLTGAYRWGVPGSRVIQITKRATKDQESERRRGWFHVI